ncbi:MAG: NAD-dependent epimerase/dehydratase family protein [Verrucomicrobia bacterium]|nr:NAD-dependent epimerase/dehydratase family protein [Verrucomicrobiota bacterium]
MGNRLERILVTGGAGFVGSTLAVAFKQRFPETEVLALDNLRRRGAELILHRLYQHGIKFVHGDIRVAADLPVGDFDLLLECSAEPSVLAGYHTAPDYLLHTNLTGALHCLEFCRLRCPRLIFISTSRVYSIPRLRQLSLRETATRFAMEATQGIPGASDQGIDEDFPTSGPRSLYGATKLAAEMFVEEYRHAYGLKTVIDRCGVLAGPWQMGKQDQGVFTFWMAGHFFNRPLRYIGFGGHGKQVRDLLHAEDLASLVLEQAGALDQWDGSTVNVGGGVEVSLSLREATELCRRMTGNSPSIAEEPKDRPMDVPCYLSDCSRLFSRTEWRPRHGPERILSDTFEWMRKHETALRSVL